MIYANLTAGWNNLKQGVWPLIRRAYQGQVSRHKEKFGCISCLKSPNGIENWQEVERSFSK